MLFRYQQEFGTPSGLFETMLGVKMFVSNCQLFSFYRFLWLFPNRILNKNFHKHQLTPDLCLAKNHDENSLNQPLDSAPIVAIVGWSLTFTGFWHLKLFWTFVELRDLKSNHIIMDDYCIIYTNLGIVTLGTIKCIKRTYNAVLAPSLDSGSHNWQLCENCFI